ncbi:MAG: HAD-IC family P-type ATPase [Nanoarchaeota archaeon]
MQRGKNYHSKSIKEIFSEFQTSEKGLTQEQAKTKLEKYGKNEIKKTHRLRPLKILIQQFNSFLIYILLIAAIISFIISNFLDGIVISIIIIINGIIGFTQQYKAEKAISNLKKLIVSHSKVIRNNKVIEIPSQELVSGDIIIIGAGDKVNADCRILEAENTQTNEAALTGESLPISKKEKQLPKETILAKRTNMLFAGTQIVRGNAKALIISTGMQTEFGKIAENLQKIETQKTPIQKRLDKFSKQIGVIIILIVSLIALLGFVEKFNTLELFLTSVALAVSAIPEGLPAVLTISFAISSILMSKQNVIIRRLPAVETLGSVTVICSDKTGTITKEQMQVQKIFSNNKFYTKKNKNLFQKNKKTNLTENKELYKLIKTSVLCNNARYEFIDKKYNLIGDPTETALISNSLDLGIDKKSLIEQEPSTKKFDFSSKRKMMSIIRDNGRNNIMYSKGAIEKILENSSFELINGQIKNLTDKRKKELLEKSKIMEKDALRVLAFAYKNFNKKEKPIEKGLIFLGLTGMIDPPREEIKKAVEQSFNAGIKIKIITGDALLTAVSIAKQIGIKGRAITGKELEKISDTELEKHIEEIVIFARTNPLQKLRITKILQKKGEVVAITGDGINDTLALKAADIGIAMGIRGTDVAREVSDVVLIDDNFASIVEGIKQGRKTYDNIKKFAKYLLAVNFSEIFLILTAVILAITINPDKWFLPLLPLQILWMNLVTDSLPALSLIFEKEENVMETKPRKEKSILDNIWKFVILGGFVAFFVEIILYFMEVLNNTSAQKTQTIVLTTAVLFELLFVYTCRSKESLFKIGVFSNKWLNYSVIISIILHLILLYTPLSVAFGVIPLGIKDWLIIIPFAFSGLLIFEIGKILRKK